jgi:hypothetical protein
MTIASEKTTYRVYKGKNLSKKKPLIRAFPILIYLRNGNAKQLRNRFHGENHIRDCVCIEQKALTTFSLQGAEISSFKKKNEYNDLNKRPTGLWINAVCRIINNRVSEARSKNDY